MLFKTLSGVLIQMMNKLPIIISLYFSVSNLSAQNIEIAGVLNRNNYYDFTKDELHYTTRYNVKNGFAFSLSAEDTLLKTFYAKFVLTLDHYNGSIYTTDGGLASSSTTDADVEKTVLGLDFYPLNFKICKVVWLNFGASFNYLLNAEMNGHHSWWQASPGGIISGHVLLDASADHYVKKFTPCLSVRIAPEIKIGETWSLLPQYLIRLGLSSEFRNVEANIKSLRHYLGIGIMKRLKKGSA